MTALGICALLFLAVGLHVWNEHKEPEYVRVKLELPEREKVEIDWGDPCENSGTIVCQNLRKNHE